MSFGLNKTLSVPTTQESLSVASGPTLQQRGRGGRKDTSHEERFIYREIFLFILNHTLQRVKDSTYYGRDQSLWEAEQETLSPLSW